MIRTHLWKRGHRQECCLNCGKPAMLCDNAGGEDCRLTRDMKMVLIVYADQNGSRWKSKLLALWQSGQDTGILRLVRNIIGPSKLHKLRLEYLKR